MAKVYARNKTADSVFIPARLSSGKKTGIGIAAGIGSEVELTAFMTAEEVQRNPEIAYAIAQNYISVYSSIDPTQQGQNTLRFDLTVKTPTTPPTIAAYNVNVDAGELNLNGTRLAITAAADLDLASAIAKTIAGGAITALATLFKRQVAVCVAIIGGVLVTKCIHGADVATSGTSVRPTRSEINAGMLAGFTVQPNNFAVVAYVEHSRTGAVVTQTFADVLL